jgi:antitoxin (DNA-binding transcriptional repressor) of toxin-antitoxin stability system
MKFRTVTELRLSATKIVQEIEVSGEEVVITKKGKPVVLMRRMEQEEFALKKGDKKGT